jgi:hypothetical protein
MMGPAQSGFPRHAARRLSAKEIQVFLHPTDTAIPRRTEARGSTSKFV